MDLRIDPAVGSLLRVGLIRAEPVRVRPAGPALVSEVRLTCDRLIGEHGGKKPSEIPDLSPARTLYKAFGIDPTRIRPSSEALLRRILKGKPFPEILNAVDVANLCSLLFLLPLGLYDSAKTRSPVTLRRGRDGESYPGIRKDDVHLHGRPVLADPDGPFGNPTSDSARTAVGSGTVALWMVIFAPRPLPTERLASHVDTARELMRRHLGPPGTEVKTTGDVLA